MTATHTTHPALTHQNTTKDFTDASPEDGPDYRPWPFPGIPDGRSTNAPLPTRTGTPATGSGPGIEMEQPASATGRGTRVAGGLVVVGRFLRTVTPVLMLCAAAVVLAVQGITEGLVPTVRDLNAEAYPFLQPPVVPWLPLLSPMGGAVLLCTAGFLTGVLLKAAPTPGLVGLITGLLYAALVYGSAVFTVLMLLMPGYGRDYSALQDPANQQAIKDLLAAQTTGGPHRQEFWQSLPPLGLCGALTAYLGHRTEARHDLTGRARAAITTLKNRPGTNHRP